MKIYLAAMYQSMELMRRYAKRLEEEGHEITSTWIHGAEMYQTRTDAAQMDLDDIERADVVISFTLLKGTLFSSGGRHVEFGYAVARQKRLIVIGDRENIFHHLPQVEMACSFQDAISILKGINKGIKS